MKIVIIDGQGGKLGQQIADGICKANIDCELLGIGTNSAATSALLKGGVHNGATGENPVLVACRDADIIIGPIGIISADSLFGEITPAMAIAIGQSNALKLLLPVSHCDNQVIGVKHMTMSEMINETITKINEYISKDN